MRLGKRVGLSSTGRQKIVYDRVSLMRPMAALEFPAEPTSGARASGSMELLPKTQSILDRPFMEFRPFGVTPDGQKIRDVSGATVKANIEYLEEVVGKKKGKTPVDKPLTDSAIR